MAALEPPPSHILVVDDDRRIRELLTSYLSAQGFRVTAAKSAEEARERMRGLSFDLIVLDVMMSGETGLDLLRSLREKADAVPVLVLSALADSGDRIAGLASGRASVPAPSTPSAESCAATARRSGSRPASATSCGSSSTGRVRR